MTQITVPDVPTFVEYSVTSASTGPFVVPFAFFDEDDVFATVTDALGVETALVHTTDFTFSVLTVPVGQEGNGYEGGELDLVASIGADGATTLRIYRSTVIDRTSNFPSTGPFSMPLLNDEQNRFVLMMQEHTAELDDLEAADVTLQANIDANGVLIAGNTTNITNNTAAIGAIPSFTPTTPIYPLSQGETDAGVSPSDYTWPVGHVNRYGADPTGATDSAAAFQAAIDSVGRLKVTGFGADIIPDLSVQQ